MPEWWETEPEQEFRPAVDAADLLSEQQKPLTFRERTRAAYDNGDSNYWASWGIPGHTKEYVVLVRGYGQDEYIPDEYGEQLQEQVGEDFTVMNRGTRLELTSRREDRGPDDEKVKIALDAVIDGKHG